MKESAQFGNVDQRLVARTGTIRPLVGPYSAPTWHSHSDNEDVRPALSGMFVGLPADLRRDSYVGRSFSKLTLLACASEERHPLTGELYLKVRHQPACIAMDARSGMAWQGPGFNHMPSSVIDPLWLSEVVLVRANQGQQLAHGVDVARVTTPLALDTEKHANCLFHATSIQALGDMLLGAYSNPSPGDVLAFEAACGPRGSRPGGDAPDPQADPASEPSPEIGASGGHKEPPLAGSGMMPGTTYAGRDILMSAFPPNDPRHRRTRKGAPVGVYLKKALSFSALDGHLRLTDVGDISCDHPVPVAMFDYAVGDVDGVPVTLYDSLMAFFPIKGANPDQKIKPPEWEHRGPAPRKKPGDSRTAPEIGRSTRTR